MSRVRFVKGHGTENDFVILPDLAGNLALSDAEVAAICDRRAGIGADGILRVVRVDAAADAAEYAGAAEYFMDYRNADGSKAQMCGNGIRVFARYLVDAALAPAGELAIATRGGIRRVGAPAAGDVSVDMGAPQFPDLAGVQVRVGGRSWPAHAITIPNPHAVVFVDDLAEAGDLRSAPAITPGAFPDGVNVEFVVARGPRHVAMRVHERGVGETRSCGTGACAVMVAAARRDGAARPVTYTVDVAGGRLLISQDADGRVEMSGPAVLVAHGEIDLPLDIGSNAGPQACEAGPAPAGVGVATGSPDQGRP
ncbi:MAG: diaminopimelate epimerase [Sporichthyaceae bacterium]